jgi:large conductance mechanosensitive channel
VVLKESATIVAGCTFASATLFFIIRAMILVPLSAVHRSSCRIRKRGKQMKSFMKEFKEFISRGNVMDMAVGIMIGGAFTAIVTSLVEDIISPILGLFGGLNFDKLSVTLLGEVTLNYGKFITAVINFLIMAFILFSIIKAMNTAAGKIKKEEEEAAPTTKMCPYCRSEDVPLEATRCPHCTSQLETQQQAG